MTRIGSLSPSSRSPRSPRFSVFRETPSCGYRSVRSTSLVRGLTIGEISAFQEDYTCPHCGAHLTKRTFVDHEYGDTELEMFACGHTRGWMSRPCPEESRFPGFEDYELVSFQEADGGWWCEATGKTQSAREVSLQTGHGRSKEEAMKWVERSYIQDRYGYEAAEVFLPIGG